MVGVAVKVTDEPAQVGFVPVAMAILTDGVVAAVTVISLPLSLPLCVAGV